MEAATPNLELLNQRLRVHWLWATGLSLFALLIVVNLAYSVIEDSGGRERLGKVGLTGAVAHTMTEKIVEGVQGKHSTLQAARSSIVWSLVQFLLLAVAALAARARLERIERLRHLREELELRGSAYRWGPGGTTGRAWR